MQPLSPKLPWELANPKWAAALNPLLASPIVNGILLEPTALTTGDNVINHLLQRKLQGYLVVLSTAGITLYDKQATNQMPDLTLILNASGAATVTLYVF